MTASVTEPSPDSVLHELPTAKGWPRKRFKYLGRFVGGGTPSRNDESFWNGNIPWASPKDMSVWSVQDTQDYISSEGLADSSAMMVPRGSLLLVVRSGVLKHTIPVAVNEIDVALNQDMQAFIPGPEISARFLMYAIAGHQGRLLLAWRKVGATVESLETEYYENFELPVPPLAAQDAIIRFLDRKTERIDTLIAKKQRMIELLEEKRQVLITQTVTKGLDPNVPMKETGIPWLGDVPEHWGVGALRWYLRVSSGEFLSNDAIDRDRSEHSLYQVIGGNGVSGYSSFTNIRRPMVVVGRVGALCGNVHLVEEPSWVTDNALMIYRWRDFEASYLAFWLRALDLNTYANKTAQPLVTGELVKNQLAILPPRSEQSAIGDYCRRVVQEINDARQRLERQVQILVEYRQSLISAAVTGKIDVSAEAA